METVERIVIAVIVAFPGILIALATLLRVMRTEDKQRDLHMLVNSRLDQLLARTEQLARLEGEKTGRLHAVPPATQTPPTV